MMTRLLLLLLLLFGPALAQPPDCTCPTGSSTSTTPTTTTFPSVLGPGDRVEGEAEIEEPQAPEEEEVGDFNEWIKNNPDSPIKNLVEQAKGDPGLKDVLDQLTPSELNNLGEVLTTYQNSINTYVKDNPRFCDSAGGGLRNFFNSLAAIGGHDHYVRGCADMAERALQALGPKTGGNNPFTVHHYDWTPGAARQYGAYFGLPVVAVVVVKSAGAGTVVGGPVGTVVGGGTGLVIALTTGNTEHNMAALQSVRNPKLIIVLDPHAAQNGNPESVHGPAHYTGYTGSPSLGPARVPPTRAADATPKIEKGTVTR